MVRGCVDGHCVRDGFFLDGGQAAFLGLGSHFFFGERESERGDDGVVVGLVWTDGGGVLYG